MPNLYIERVVRVGDEDLSETQLLARTGPIVVLAEPGAGKSDLLDSLARQLGTVSIPATRFRTPSYVVRAGAVVIDGMDEVAKLGRGELNDIVAKAAANGSGRAVFASRSGEWETARTKFVASCFGRDPVIARLRPFGPAEQEALLRARFPMLDVSAFMREAGRFDLDPLLGNPEFLQLFGLAFIRNDGRFTSKRQIYADAAEQLAIESNEVVEARQRPQARLLVQQAGSVFARLLLSGASGVSLRQAVDDDHHHPFFRILDAEVGNGMQHLLDSKLFRPAGDPNHHDPVHRIVAEYLAAEYLVRRIGDTGDSLSLSRCLAIVAPNGVVRDELRGLLGWMAALGDDRVQKRAIALDAYAVLANGDPSQLTERNKILLLEDLKQLAETDPFFRRNDQWRSFNVGQFFSTETVTALRPILASRSRTHLQGLVLELLDGTPAVASLVPELEGLMLDADISENARLQALALLLDVPGYDSTVLFDHLLAEASPASIRMAAEIVQAHGAATMGLERTLSLLRGLASVHGTTRGRRRSDTSHAYFLRKFLETFPPHDIEFYLDALTAELACSCEPRREYACQCRAGISRVVGGLLDRYFAERSAEHDAARLWSWMGKLRFSSSGRTEESTAILALRTDAGLRQSIQAVAIAGATSLEEHHQVQMQFYSGRGHVGLFFKAEDLEALLHRAFETGDDTLWKTIWRRHNFYGNKTPDRLRRIMREQASRRASLLAIWSGREHGVRQWRRANRTDFSTSNKKWERREARVRQENFNHLQRNRAQIAAGRHWGWLRTFAHILLVEPDRWSEEVDSLATLHAGLRNCLDSLAPHVPSLGPLGLREQKALGVAMILHAACLLRFRETGDLEGVSMDVLKAVRTELSHSSGVTDDEADALEAEVDRILFADPAAPEAFGRQYIEPSLAGPRHAHTPVGILTRMAPLRGLMASLPLEWLRRLPDMPFQAETALFEMMIQHASSANIRAIIVDRCAHYEHAVASESDPGGANRRTEWLLNALFMTEDARLRALLLADKDAALSIAARLDRFAGSDDRPQFLSAAKILHVLDASVEHWPKVKLSDSFGSSSPNEEKGYRLLHDLIWRLNRDTPSNALEALDRLLSDKRFDDFRSDLLAVRATMVRRLALLDFQPPTPATVSAMLERSAIASVEDMRALMAESLEQVEERIRHSETDALDSFHPRGRRVDENTARNRIVDHLEAYFLRHGLSVQIEHHTAGGNRCDITASAVIGGRRSLLMTEVKGQWHPELFTAAEAQLLERYSTHPDAGQQGVYLVLWFGADEAVAGRMTHGFGSPGALRSALMDRMTPEVRSRIDVVVMDLSPSRTAPSQASAMRRNRSKSHGP